MKIKNNVLKSIGLWVVQAATFALLCTGCGGGSSGNSGTSAAAAIAPAITTQPASQSVAAGTAVNFSVVASGSAPLSYQWKRNGVDVNGATAASYSLATAQLSDTQSKWNVVVRNAAGSVTSSEATLTVTEVVLLAGTQGYGNVDGIGAAARFSDPESAAIDTAGNIYVAERSSYSVRKITPDGVVTTLAGGTPGITDGIGTAASFYYVRGIAVDAAGNVYVTECLHHTIRKITPAGVVTTLAGSSGVSGSADGSGAAALFNLPAGIAVDGAGNVYVADTGNNTIRKITPAGTVTTLAGAVGVPGSTDDIGTAARFSSPTGLAGDGSGNIYVADTGNSTVRKISPAGVVTTLAGTVGVSGTTDGTGAAARFDSLDAMAVDGTGNVFVTDTYNHIVRKISSAGVVTTLAGTLHLSGSTDGTGAVARFKWPEGVAVDDAGTIYVADSGNDLIRKITQAGTVTTLAGRTPDLTDGVGEEATFYFPSGVAVDGSGNVYVADTENQTIRKITPAGEATTLAGATGLPGSTDGTGAAARFYNPVAVALDGAGNVYVADTGNATIRKITSTGEVTTLAGTAGQIGLADGHGAAASFLSVQGVAVDGAGNVYAADTGSNTIRKITPDGDVTTLAGLARIAGSVDGAGTTARFNGPTGIAADGAGNVYVADTGNYTIRKITPAGMVTTLAGTTGLPGSTDGTGAAARFYYPDNIAVDGAGNVYVTENLTGNTSADNAVRKITPAGVVTTVASNVKPAHLSGLAIDANGVLYVTVLHAVLKILL